MEKRKTIKYFIIYFSIGTVPILFGAVRPWIWSFYVFGIYLAYLIKYWHAKKNEPCLFGKTGRFFVTSFSAWSIFQIIPFPPTVISLLSPWKSMQYGKAMSILEKKESWETVTYFWRVSLSELSFFLSLVFLYILCSDVLKKRQGVHHMVWVIIALGAIESVYGIVQSLLPAIGVLWMDPSYAYIGMARGTFVNKNNFAGLMEMILPVTIGYTVAIGYWPIRGKLKKFLTYDHVNKVLFLTILVISMLLGLFFSISRAGIIGFIVAILSFSLISRAALKRNLVVIYVMIGIVLVLFCIYGETMGVDPILDRFLKIGSETSRLDIWKDSLAMCKDHPLGVGIGNYEYVYPLYHLNFKPHLNVLDAHNDYLQVLAESGWPGFIILVGGYLFFMITRIRMILDLNPERDPLLFFLGGGAMSGLVAIGFHSFFDFNLQIPANCIYFVILMALIDTAVGGDHRINKKNKKMRMGN